MGIEFKDYYAVLGVKKDASADEIKRAYRRLAKRHHPDLHVERDKAGATGRFQELNEAYEVLSDPEKRAKYDRAGPGWEGGREPGSAARSGEARAGGREETLSGFSDFFEAFFGDAGARGFGRRGTSAGGPPGGQDIEAELPLTLEDSLRGGDKKLSIRTPVLCHACRGSGRRDGRFCPACAGVGEALQERSITVHLPRLVRDGTKLRLRGQAAAASGSAPAGDLFLRIRLLPHPKFRVSGDDLETTVVLAPGVAAVGGEAAVPALEGPVSIRIPPGTRSGRRLRVAGRGLAKKGGGRGDLYAEARIDIPGRLDENLERLYRELREAGS